MENHVMQEVCRMIGPDWGDGLFCPGGSYGNGTAINLARFERYPDVKKKGSNHIPRQAIFASEECHYSVYKYASFLGIGEDNVFSIRTNDMGEMIVEDLEKKIEQQIEEGAVPLVVVATFGTTVKGAFDPINQIADVSKKHSMWLHIDAAWGGSLIFSQKHRSKLNGIERANSVVINVHKLLAVPQQCSMLLIRDKGILHKCFSRGAEYLFQKDKHYDKTYDVGDKYLQCGRKCDVFKFWFMWKAKGSSGFASHVDALMDLAEYFEEQVNKRSEFMLVSKRQYINVCFWYLPRYLRGKANVLEHSVELNKVAPKIRAFMVENGSLMLGYQPLKQLPNFSGLSRRILL
uniref:Cysteine sulfinic acid decarboxylase n=1 Tax=Anoplophora glabripennis TaxID=217634 RepID=V5GQ54_ANOGL